MIRSHAPDLMRKRSDAALPGTHPGKALVGPFSKRAPLLAVVLGAITLAGCAVNPNGTYRLDI
jgi:hypothetical protein